MSGRGFNLNDYATVDDRITKYWAMHPKPEGSIQTEIIWVSNDGNSVAIKATVYLGERILATGIAQEERGSKGANSTSWWENCETSAIGRALANMDMSLSKNRPSRQEMEKVERYENRPQPIPARSQAARPAPPAAAPAPVVLTDEQEQVIAQAWDMAEAHDTYAAVIALIRTLRAAATPEQWDVIKEKGYAIQQKHYAPASIAG